MGRGPVSTITADGTRGTSEAPTVLASWTATVVRTLDARGVDGHDLAGRAGIDAALLDVDGARVPLAASSRLWHLAVEATGDPCIGLDVARHARPSTFHGLSVGVVTSGRFREALERIVRFAAVVCSPSGQSRLEEVDGRLVYETRWPPGATTPSHESMEAILACVVRAGRFLMGRGLSPCSVELLRPQRPEPSRFESFFGCEVDYGAARYALAFPSEVTDAPLPTGCDEVARTADHVVGAYLERVAPGGEMTEQVRQAVAQLVGRGDVTSSAVASRIAVSARTMQRRLQDEGTTFRSVVADVRMALAKQAIATGEAPVHLVADRLGFSDAAAFRRAFKRSTGMTPSAYADTPHDDTISR
jgi:AraC-like DNA-binding protein